MNPNVSQVYQMIPTSGWATITATANYCVTNLQKYVRIAYMVLAYMIGNCYSVYS
jgi:hypothetical protein